MLKWFHGKFAFVLVGSLLGGCGGLRSESDDGSWTLVDVGSTGETVVVAASPWSVTAVVDYARVYDSADGLEWSLIETPEVEPEWAGRTAEGLVVVGIDGRSATESEGTWTECDIAPGEDVLIRDGMITHGGVFILGVVQGEFRLWVQVAGENCVWSPIGLPLPPSSGEVSPWFEMQWAEEGLVVFPSQIVEPSDFYWILDPNSLDAELRTGRRHQGEVRVLSEYSGTTEPEVSIETAAGLEIVELPVAQEGGRHTVGPGRARGDELVLIGSVYLGDGGQGPFRSDILEWTRDGSEVRVATAATVGGFGVSMHDLVEFNGVWITGGSYVGSGDGRTPFVLVRAPSKSS